MARQQKVTSAETQSVRSTTVVLAEVPSGMCWMDPSGPRSKSSVARRKLSV